MSDIANIKEITNAHDYTVEMWVRPDGKGSVQTQLASEIPAMAELPPVELDKLKPNEWSHISVVKSSGKPKLFINGEAAIRTVTIVNTGYVYEVLDTAANAMKLVFPDRPSLVVYLTKLRILNPEIIIEGDTNE
jgi:hypothetical protein